MDGRAPGDQASQNEPPCYNCGMKGHMFTACPEPTRSVPAGLEASKQRQKSSNSPGGYGQGSGRKSKGPVITRYPLPPNPAPSMARVDPSASQPFSSASPPGYQPYPPPYSHGYGAPHPAPPNVPFDHNGRYGPPVPAPVAYTHPPPPLPHRHSHYDYQYGPPGPSGPPPSLSHGPLPAAPYIPNTHQGAPPIPPPPGVADQYPHHPPSGPPNQYYHGPPQSYHPPPPAPPLPPPQYSHQGPPYGYQGPPGYYPPSYGLPPPIPPVSHHYQPPPHGPNPGQPYREERDRRGRHGRRGYSDHRAYDDRRPVEHWDGQGQWQQAPGDSTHHRDDRYRDNRHWDEDHGNRRSREWERDKSRSGRPRDRQDRYHQNNSPSRPDRDHRPRKRQRSVFTPAQSTPHSAPSATVDTPQESEPGEVKSEVNADSDHEDATSEYDTNGDKNPYKGFSWDQQAIFNEPPESQSQGDPIGVPLPTEYTENIILPPTFGAKGVQSKYITLDNLDDFAQSIRETREWQVMQHHPAFLDPKEIQVQKLEDFSKVINASSSKSNRRDRHNNHHDSRRHHGKHRDWQGRNQHRDFSDHGLQQKDFHQRPDSRKRKWEGSQHDSDLYRLGKRRSSLEYGESRNKMFRPTSPEPGEVVEDGAGKAALSRPRTPVASVEDPAWAPEVGEVLQNQEGSKQTQDTYRYFYEETFKVHEEIMAQDEKRFRDSSRSYMQANTQDEGPPTRPPTPPPLHSDHIPTYSRPSSRHSSRSRQGSQPNSRRSSFGGHVSESNGSPLTPTELELLGLGRPSSSGSDTGRESPKRQPADVAPKTRRRQTRVNEAYSRRW